MKAVFFDLFFTLVHPQYLTGRNEYDVLGISAQEWEAYAENSELYNERALGKIKDEKEIVDKIVRSMPYKIDDRQLTELLALRKDRMKRALLEVDEQILHTLRSIADKDIKICLISNADVIDCKYWSSSPLAPLFDAAVFSSDVGMMKPDLKMYQYALNSIHVSAKESLFVGDGGFDELAGARRAGMKSVFTEYLDRKADEKRKALLNDADYCIQQFDELIDLAAQI